MEPARISRVYQALEAPRVLAGADYSLCMINVGVLLFMIMSLRLWFWIPIAGIIHLLLRQLTGGDPHMRKIYIRYSMQANRYDPWPQPVQKRGFRPQGFGKDSIC
jgi:type IV secretory pathway TrbD component